MQPPAILENYETQLNATSNDFEQFLAKGDITSARERMTDNRELARRALAEYDTSRHPVMARRDKIIKNKNGENIRKDEVWKLPIPYQTYINEIALVFLYGQPVKWTQASDGTDDAYKAFTDVIRRTRFDSKIRQAKRLAGAETQSALLFRVYKDDDGKPDVQIRVLAESKGDEIYYRFDQYESLTAFAWGYYLREEDRQVYHFDIFTKNVTYRCAQRNAGWEVIREPNFIGKIPVILLRQEKEWHGVENLIHREEYIASRTADTNDYFADPIMIMNADVIRNMPERKDANKTLITKTEMGVGNVASYLTWDSAPQSKKDELEWLRMHILSKTFTPDISLDTLRSVSNLSGKALRTVMLLADIKAARRKETHDELLDRTASLVIAIIGNVLDVALATQCANLVVTHAFGEPFGEDIEAALKYITQAQESGIMSQETAVEQNPIIADAAREKERLAAEAEERNRRQNDIFGDMSQAGPAAYGESSQPAQPADNDNK